MTLIFSIKEIGNLKMLISRNRVFAQYQSNISKFDCVPSTICMHLWAPQQKPFSLSPAQNLMSNLVKL